MSLEVDLNPPSLKWVDLEIFSTKSLKFGTSVKKEVPSSD